MRKISILILVGTILTLSSAQTLFKSSYLKSQNIVNGYRFAASAIPADYVAYYPFNGNADDESGNGYDGTVTGAYIGDSTDRHGNTNSCYYFDGTNDYITINSSFTTVFNTMLNDQYTVSIWFKSLSDATIFNAILDFRDGGGDGYRIGHESWVFVGDTVLINHNSNSIYFTNSPPESAWYNLTVVRDGDSAMVYVNGVTNDIAYDVSLYTINVTTQLTFGSRSFSKPATVAYGLMDDIRIYNRALVESEIISIVNEPSP